MNSYIICEHGFTTFAIIKQKANFTSENEWKTILSLFDSKNVLTVHLPSMTDINYDCCVNLTKGRGCK